MYVHPRKDRNGQTYYSFSYTNEEGQRVRLKKDEHPVFRRREEAETWAKGQEGIRQSRKDAHQRKLAWRTAHYDFVQLLQLYENWQKERAPNSWSSCIGYLELWVFPYFLQERHSANVNDWHLQFREFRDWLGSDRALETRGRKTPLAISTQNNIIKALNTFLECLRAYNKIDPASAQKCEAYPEHKLNHRGVDAVIQPAERDRIHAALRTINPGVADFWMVLWHTGMRFSELFGLPMNALVRGEITTTAGVSGDLKKQLIAAGIEYHGYLYLDSQPQTDDRRREPDGTIARKPLKSCKAIAPRYARVIPIREREVWNILAVRFKEQQKEFLQKRWGQSQRNYPLFDDLEWNKVYGALKAAYKACGLPVRGFHDCRHSFATFLVGETGNSMLVRMITGHRSTKAFERYLHIYEQIALAARQDSQDIDVI